MGIIAFDKKVKCGPEFVALRILDKIENLNMGEIYIPQTTGENMRLGFYIIEDIGSKASEETNLKVGEYVLADRLSSFAHTEPVCLMKYNNIICKTNKERNGYIPLRNQVFVKHDKKEDVSNVGGVYVQNYTAKLNTGTIVSINVDDTANIPFQVGDRVMLVKGGDQIDLGDTTFTIYKPDMLICKFV